MTATLTIMSIPLDDAAALDVAPQPLRDIALELGVVILGAGLHLGTAPIRNSWAVLISCVLFPGRFMIRLLLALVVLVCSAPRGYAAIPPIPEKAENCGDRFEQFRELLTSVELADKAAVVLADEAIYAHDFFVRKRPALTPEQKAELKQNFESAFRARASASGGLVDIAACWHSMVTVRDFDFDGYRETIVLLRPESFTLGSQLLDWVGRDWCPRVWNSVVAEVQASSTFPVPSFNGFSWCPNRQAQHEEVAPAAKPKVSRRKK